MASPNASFRLQLERSAIFTAQPEKYCQQWLKKCLELGQVRCTKPANGEVFDSLDDCFQRLWDWGFSAGCFSVEGRHRKGPPASREYHCCYHGTKLEPSWRQASFTRQRHSCGISSGRHRKQFESQRPPKSSGKSKLAMNDNFEAFMRLFRLHANYR